MIRVRLDLPSCRCSGDGKMPKLLAPLPFALLPLLALAACGGPGAELAPAEPGDRATAESACLAAVAAGSATPYVAATAMAPTAAGNAVTVAVEGAGARYLCLTDMAGRVREITPAPAG
jgi:hypothetical protein